MYHETKVKLEHGPYLEPMPSWEEVVKRGYLKSMDYFHATFEIRPLARSWGPSGLKLETVTTHTRVVVWTHATRPTLLVAFGGERDLTKAIDHDGSFDESKLDELSYEIDGIVEDANREAQSAW